MGDPNINASCRYRGGNKNRVSDGKLRKSQLLTSFGVGAIVEINDQSLMGMDISRWSPSITKNKKYRISPIPRLEKMLKKSFFISPPTAPSEIWKDASQTASIPYHRFPKWLECRKCNSLRNYQSQRFTAYKDLSCLKCGANSKFLSPIRFIYSGDNGYLDDISWDFLLHVGETSGCRENHLTKKTLGGRGGGLSAIEISCDKCGAKKNLNQIKGLIHLQNPRSSHPWEQRINTKIEKKDHQPFQQRGATSLYQPRIVSALDLSGSDYEDDIGSEVDQFLQDHEDILDARKFINDAKEMNIWSQEVDDNKIKNVYEKINSDLPLDFEKIPLEKIKSSIHEEKTDVGGKNEEVNLDDVDSESLKIAEYALLNDDGRQKIKNYDGEKYFISDKTLSKYIRSVTKIRRLREVRVLSGYTRHFYPKIHNINASEKVLPWLPGYEVFGEGIFIDFNSSSIKSWIKKNSKAIASRLSVMQKRRDESSTNLPFPSAKFVLLHTFSHLMIKQLCFESGYGSSALKERIYVGDDQNKMQGILIYTADGDTEGSLGGLVRMGEEQRLMNSIESLISSAKWCSSDPACLEIGSPGTRGLNKAACHACCLISETSCVYMNALLDRGLIVGSEKENLQGFFDL